MLNQQVIPRARNNSSMKTGAKVRSADAKLGEGRVELERVRGGCQIRDLLPGKEPPFWDGGLSPVKEL